MNNGQDYAGSDLAQVVAKTEKILTFNQIKRKNYRRIMTIYSNVLTGYYGDKITKQIGENLKEYKMPTGITYSFSGVQEEQAKNQGFLVTALLLALAGIMIIIVLQFNSVSKTLITTCLPVLLFQRGCSTVMSLPAWTLWYL